MGQDMSFTSSSQDLDHAYPADPGPQ